VTALLEVANDVRRQRGAGAVGLALPRNKRLVALLAAVAIVGGGSAIAGIPELRHAIKSVFGAGVAEPAGAASTEPGAVVTFGPLGDVLSIAPTVLPHAGPGERRVEPRSVAVSRRRSRQATPAAPITRGALGRPAPTQGLNHAPARVPKRRSRKPAPKSGGPTRSKPPASTNPTTPSTNPTTPSTGPTNTATGESTPVAQDAPAPKPSNGKGRALGKNVPTPRPPAQQPSQNKNPGGGRPDPPGRTDPPALGHESGPGAVIHGQSTEKGGASRP
jgi:hypothetical protein